jgi:hypothetical protein
MPAIRVVASTQNHCRPGTRHVRTDPDPILRPHDPPALHASRDEMPETRSDRLDPCKPARTLRDHARSIVTVLLLVMGLVHCPNVTVGVQAEPARKAPKPAIGPGAQTKPQPPDPCSGPLPPAVAEMREAILAAARGGRIDDLRGAIELNEIKPDSGAPAGGDPIAHWRGLDVPGDGRRVLEIAVHLLDSPPVCLPLGRDLENNRLFVWPRFSETKPETWSADDTAVLGRIASSDEIAKMRLAGAYDGWRMVIGADGVWHVFAKSDDARIRIESGTEPK